LDQGFSVKEVCEQFDLQDGALRRWVKQVQFERKGGCARNGGVSPGVAENQIKLVSKIA